MASESRDSARAREVVGVFSVPDSLEAAAARLVEMGFSKDSLGLMAPAEPVGWSTELGAAAHARSPVAPMRHGAPEEQALRNETRRDVGQAGLGALSLAGSTALGAAVVASSGVLGGAALAAVAGAATIGAIGAVMSRVIHESDAEYLAEQLDKGRLLLFAVVDGNEERERTARVMLEYGAVATVGVSFARPDG